MEILKIGCIFDLEGSIFEPMRSPQPGGAPKRATCRQKKTQGAGNGEQVAGSWMANICASNSTASAAPRAPAGRRSPLAGPTW